MERFISCAEMNKMIGTDMFRFDHAAEVIDNIYILTDDPDISLDDNRPKYLGYETMGKYFDRRDEQALCDDDITLCKEVVRQYKGKPTVIDVGAGTGRYSIPFALAGARVLAADISVAMLKVLLEKMEIYKLQDIYPCRINAFTLPINDQCIEIAFVSALLHLVENPELVLKEISRVLTNNGILVVFNTVTLEIEDEKLVEQNKKFNDVWSYAYKRYGDLGLEKNQKYLLRPGWWMDKQHENILKVFPISEKIEMKNLITEGKSLLSERLYDLENLAYSNFLLFDREISKEIVAQVRKEICEKFGAGYSSLYLTYKCYPEVIIFRKGSQG